MIEIEVSKKLKAASDSLILEINLEIESESFTTIYGKSGAGKTSLLKILAGLLNPDQGSIKVKGETWFDKNQKVNLKPQKRNCGFVFQDYALFPNMTVRGNLEFALSKKQEPHIISELMDIMDLTRIEGRKPGLLSGGEQQRVALARALVQQPKLLLLDEPLTALDDDMRLTLQQHILQLHQKYRLTTILVSHEVTEIINLSDYLVEIDQGKIIREGEPSAILAGSEVSGKFQFTGKVVGIEKQDVVVIVKVLIGRNLVKVVADHEEARNLNVGDKVLVASKAFNPIIKKISN